LSISAKEPPAALIKFIAAVRAIDPATWAALEHIKRQQLKVTNVNDIIAAAVRHRARWQSVLACFGWLPNAVGVTNVTMGLPVDATGPLAPIIPDDECRAALTLLKFQRTFA
jgi:hypothetical protein